MLVGQQIKSQLGQVDYLKVDCQRDLYRVRIVVYLTY